MCAIKKTINLFTYLCTSVLLKVNQTLKKVNLKGGGELEWRIPTETRFP